MRGCIASPYRGWTVTSCGGYFHLSQVTIVKSIAGGVVAITMLARAGKCYKCFPNYDPFNPYGEDGEEEDSDCLEMAF